MPNPFQFISELREMNDEITGRLDQIISRLDRLVAEGTVTRQDLELLWYGDGK